MVLGIDSHPRLSRSRSLTPKQETSSGNASCTSASSSCEPCNPEFRGAAHVAGLATGASFGRQLSLWSKTGANRGLAPGPAESLRPTGAQGPGSGEGEDRWAPGRGSGRALVLPKEQAKPATHGGFAQREYCQHRDHTKVIDSHWNRSGYNYLATRRSRCDGESTSLQGNSGPGSSFLLTVLLFLSLAGTTESSRSS